MKQQHVNFTVVTILPSEARLTTTHASPSHVMAGHPIPATPTFKLAVHSIASFSAYCVQKRRKANIIKIYMCIIYMGLPPLPPLYCNTLGIQNGDRNFLGGLIPS